MRYVTNGADACRRRSLRVAGRLQKRAKFSDRLLHGRRGRRCENDEEQNDSDDRASRSLRRFDARAFTHWERRPSASGSTRQTSTRPIVGSSRTAITAPIADWSPLRRSASWARRVARERLIRQGRAGQRWPGDFRCSLARPAWPAVGHASAVPRAWGECGNKDPWGGSRNRPPSQVFGSRRLLSR